jgi:hypothetical protein
MANSFLVSAVAYSYVGVPPPTDFYERAKLRIDLKAALVRLGASSGRGQFLSTAECAKACEYVAQLESIRFLIICVGAKCLLAVDSIFSRYKFMNHVACIEELRVCRDHLDEGRHARWIT